jgi:hypothetical protein
MRYFTPELIRALSGDPPGAEAWASEEWSYRSTRYRDELERLLPKMPPRLAAFLDYGSLHEYHLERLTLNGGEPDPVLRVRFALEVELGLSYGEDMRRLVYKRVHRISLEADQARPLMGQPEPARPLLTDTWLYDELSALAPGRFRHEILLASGGVLSLDFEDFSFYLPTMVPSGDTEVPT